MEHEWGLLDESTIDGLIVERNNGIWIKNTPEPISRGLDFGCCVDQMGLSMRLGLSRIEYDQGSKLRSIVLKYN
jgi:hypothetical protein